MKSPTIDKEHIKRILEDADMISRCKRVGYLMAKQRFAEDNGTDPLTADEQQEFNNWLTRSQRNADLFARLMAPSYKQKVRLINLDEEWEKVIGKQPSALKRFIRGMTTFYEWLFGKKK